MIDNGIHNIIHLQNLRANIRRLLTQCGTLIPIVKSDAYGHGITQVAHILEEESIDTLAVGKIEEGILLRHSGIRADIIALLGMTDNNDARLAADMHIMPLVHSFEDIKRLATSAISIDVAVKCDTGMRRLGVTQDELPAFIDMLRSNPIIRPRVMISHLACADDCGKDDVTVGQIHTFTDMYTTMRTVYPDIRPSVLNSAGLLIWSELKNTFSKSSLPHDFRTDARPGLILYGENPLSGTVREELGAGFLPVMETKTRVLSVRDIRKGESLSYGYTFTAEKDMRVAIIAAGYADGYSRALSGKGHVAFHGGRAPIVGRICMQMCFTDITALPHVQPGDPVWLLGGPDDGSAQSITVSELARWADMIPYEFLCSLGKNKRIYAD